jgi:hypothetical protein
MEHIHTNYNPDICIPTIEEHSPKLEDYQEILSFTLMPKSDFDVSEVHQRRARSAAPSPEIPSCTVGIDKAWK